MKLKVGLAQMRCEKGDWEGNLRRAEEFMAEAAAQGCEMVVFPEMGLSGYCYDENYTQAARALDSEVVGRFVDLTARYDVAASGGFIEANGGDKPFVTQVLALRGRVVGVYRKTHIVDEEAKLFSPGVEMPVFKLPVGGEELTCALAICADSDRPDLFARFAEQGARVVFHSSAPGLYERRSDEESWRAGYEWYKGYLGERLPGYAVENKLAIAVATQCGATADEDFPGGSFVFGPDGSCLACTEDHREALLMCEMEILA
jgi:predicted amidohydrolase